jgi:hypothetical protein
MYVIQKLPDTSALNKYLLKDINRYIPHWMRRDIIMTYLHVNKKVAKRVKKQ